MKYIYFLIVLILLGCNDNTFTTCPIGKKIIFPIDSLIQYNSYEYKNSNTFEVVLLLEASCPVCVEEIYQLYSYLQQKNIAKAQFVVILTGHDSEFIRYHVKEINSFEFPILFDPEDKFIKINKLGIMKFNNCVLIGPDNVIKSCGSPFLEPIAEKKCRKIIKNEKKKDK